MDNATPNRAFDLLTPAEQTAVDQYVNMIEIDSVRRGERIALALDRPIPAELVRRSRGLFLKPLVLAAIAERLKTSADSQDISPRRVINEHASLAFSNIADFLKVGLFGEFEIDLTKATREQLRAVKSIKISDTPQGRKTEITLYDKQPSLIALQNVMEMPLIADVVRGNGDRKKLGKDDDATKAYTNLLESLRPA